MIYIPEELTKYLFVDTKREPDQQLKYLLTQLKDRGVITSEEVYDVMVKVDRKNFVPEAIYHHAYSDMPRPIGWNTTISAPHMHAMTLEKLQSVLVLGGKALDLGTGSGYVAACFAEMMGKDSKVYMIDHIQEITDFAISNIKK